MKSPVNSAKDAIKAYLDKRAAEDELFSVVYAKQHKNIDECLAYILGEARKRGNQVFMSDDEVWCSCCGRTFINTDSELIAAMIPGRKTCPYCGRDLHVKVSIMKKISNKSYMTILTTAGGFQVCRSFEVTRYARKQWNDSPVFNIKEVCQNWIAPDGNETIIARLKCAFNSYQTPFWSWHSKMEIRTKRGGSYSYDGKYEINTKHVYPERRLLPIVRRNGFSGYFRGLSMSEYISLLLTNNKAEQYSKTRQFGLLVLLANRGIPEKYRHAINICHRNGYQIKDATMWIDYINLLEYFGKDTHNAKYVCPKNLKREHDRLDRKRNIIEARKRKEEEKEKVAKREKVYAEEKGKYFDVTFGNDNIIVTVIRSVAEMQEEGRAMHHCVGGYYKDVDALIMSAKDNSGKRLETIEVNLKTFKIIQSRGVCNGNSPMHDEIVALVNENMHLIRSVS